MGVGCWIVEVESVVLGCFEMGVGCWIVEVASMRRGVFWLDMCEGCWIRGFGVVFGASSNPSSDLCWWVFPGEYMRQRLEVLRLPGLFFKALC